MPFDTSWLTQLRGGLCGLVFRYRQEDTSAQSQPQICFIPTLSIEEEINSAPWTVRLSSLKSSPLCLFYSIHFHIFLLLFFFFTLWDAITSTLLRSLFPLPAASYFPFYHLFRIFWSEFFTEMQNKLEEVIMWRDLWHVSTQPVSVLHF
jgi:hypothetical protein